jgi:hypothetical protein
MVASCVVRARRRNEVLRSSPDVILRSFQYTADEQEIAKTPKMAAERIQEFIFRGQAELLLISRQIWTRY